MPLKVFEVSDVGYKDETRERRARNERHLCATYTSKTSGFEVSIAKGLYMKNVFVNHHYAYRLFTVF